MEGLKLPQTPLVKFDLVRSQLRLDSTEAGVLIAFVPPSE